MLGVSHDGLWVSHVTMLAVRQEYIQTEELNFQTERKIPCVQGARSSRFSYSFVRYSGLGFNF